MYRYLPKKILKVAVFDLDGVLFDVNERLKKTLEELGVKKFDDLSKKQRNIFWRIFLSPKYMYLDNPNTKLIKHLNELKSNKIKIIIVTGRSEDAQREYTLRQLKSTGIEYDEIYFRPKNYYQKDYIFKTEIVKRLLRKGYEIIEFWDDNEEVVKRVREILPYTKVIHYSLN